MMGAFPIVVALRILFVNQYFPPDASATAYLLGELTEDLAGYHEVWVIAGRPSYNPDVSTFRPRGVHLKRTWSTRFSRADLAGRAANYCTFLATALVRSLKGPRPDVVVAMTDPPVIGLIGMLAARRHRVPFVYVCMDIFPDVGVALGRVDRPIAVRLWRSLNSLLRRGASRVVAVGRDMVEKLEAEGVPPDKVRFLPNWGNAASPKLDVNALREQMGWHGKSVVMHAGNMGLAQNLGLMLEAAGLLRDEEPEVRFVFMGDGAARPSLEERAKHDGLVNVTFLPYVPKEEAQRFTAAADLHVVSLAPGLWGCVAPSKVYGIMAAGRPFVAAVDAGSEPALLAQEHGCGLVVEPGDAHALAGAILRARDLPLDDMGRRGREAFERSYDRRIATEAYRRLLEDVAGVG